MSQGMITVFWRVEALCLYLHTCRFELRFGHGCRYFPKARHMLRAHIVITGSLLVLPSLFCSGQSSPDWRTFRRAEGFAEDTAAAVSASSQGQLTVVHPSGRLSRYNGYSVNTLEGPPLPHGKVLESPSGQLWSVTTNGLYEFRD